MRLRIRRSHIFLIIFLGLLSIGWTLFIRHDGRWKTFGSGSEIFENDENGSNQLIPLPQSSLGTSSDHKNYSKCHGIKKIDCLINNEFTISCLRTSDETHIPFSFIRRYFDIYGKLIVTKTGDEYFDWEHSYSKVYFPKDIYNYKGTYLWFDNYNVEVRDRVKLISGLKGVPISTQWEPRGHFYPIQIAQFGLSHFSKHLTLDKPRVTVLEDGLFKQDRWELTVKGDHVKIHSMENDSEIDNDNEPGFYVTNNVLNNDNKVLLLDGKEITFQIKWTKKHNDLSLSLRVKPLGDFSFTVFLKTDPDKYEYAIAYGANDIDFDEKTFTYGFGKEQKWYHIVREVGVDLSKALTVLNRKLLTKVKNLHVARIQFTGKAMIDDVILSSSAHESHFFSAVRWLVDNQDDSGGWPISTTRKLSNGALTLNPGWYSAMAQGQAISLLTRMYHHVGDQVYLKAAIRAIGLFNITSDKGGFRTYFLDKYPWYEEYPTIPSSFVLNGFIYSLFGLYDLKMSCTGTCPLAEKYFNEGIQSLKHLLSLFDTGSGTLYDLRHFTLKTEPKIARWDYHTTHINQLLYLNTLLNNHPFLSTVTKRWISYMKGKRAPHN